MRSGSDPGTGDGGLGVPGGARADPAQPLIAGLTFGRAAQVTGAHLNPRTDSLLSEDTRGPLRPRLSGFSLWPPKPRGSGLRPLLPSGGHSAESRDPSSPPLGPSPSRWLLVPPHPSPPRAPPPALGVALGSASRGRLWGQTAQARDCTLAPGGAGAGLRGRAERAPRGAHAPRQKRSDVISGRLYERGKMAEQVTKSVLFVCLGETAPI